MSDFLTQSAWAKRCGVSTRTFFRWRVAGRIPIPDVVGLPGPRWTVKVVEQTMRDFTRPVIGRPFGQKSQAFTARRQRRGDHLQFGGSSLRHAASVADPSNREQGNSIAGSR